MMMRIDLNQQISNSQEVIEEAVQKLNNRGSTKVLK